MAKRSQLNQKQYSLGIVCFVAHHVFVFPSALTMGPLQCLSPYFQKSKKSELYDPSFQTMLFHMTML